jgi:hypothetical protein
MLALFTLPTLVVVAALVSFTMKPVSGLTMAVPIRSPLALKMAPVALRSRLLVKVVLVPAAVVLVPAAVVLVPAAAPTGGILPREEPEKASPDDVPEIDVPAVVPPEPEAGMVAVEFDVVVVVVALGGVPRAPEFIRAWVAGAAKAIATEVARNAGVSLRIGVSLEFRS